MSEGSAGILKTETHPLKPINPNTIIKTSISPEIQARVNKKLEGLEKIFNLSGDSAFGKPDYFRIKDPAISAANSLARDEVASEIKLERKIEQTKREAMNNPVTGLPNFGLFSEMTQREIARIDRADADNKTPDIQSGQNLDMYMMDVDDFGAINRDTDWPTGNIVLRKVGDTLKSNTRATDIISHSGGEEFIIVVPNNSPRDEPFSANDDVTKRLVFPGERVRIGISEVNFDDNEKLRNRKITASVGKATRIKGEVFEDWLARADMASTIAKITGKNRTVESTLDNESGWIYYNDITNGIKYINLKVPENSNNGNQDTTRDMLINITDPDNFIFYEIVREKDKKPYLKQTEPIILSEITPNK